MYLYKGILLCAVSALSIVLGGCASITDQSADQALKEKRYDVARHEYLDLSKHNDAHADAKLGYMYEYGIGTRGVQIFSAEVWYRKAADLGDTESAAALGNLCEWYRGYYDQAFKWDMQAAQTGDGLAEANLAALYEHGLGVAQDHTAAQAWQQKASQQSWGDMMEFAGAASAAIAVHMRYDKLTMPSKAAGIVLVGFDYADGGQATSVEIEQSSGDKDLDALALRAVATATLPPLPPGVVHAKISHFRINIDFGIVNQPHGGFFWPTAW